LQCVAVCCRVLQCVAVCCSALQCVAVHCSVLQVLQCVAVCCSVLQCCSSAVAFDEVMSGCVAVYCSVLDCVAVCRRVLSGHAASAVVSERCSLQQCVSARFQCGVVRCSVLQHVPARSSAIQCAAVITVVFDVWHHLCLSLSFTHTHSLSLCHTHTNTLSLSLSLSLRARVLCVRVSLARHY